MKKQIIFKADKEALYSETQKRAGIYSGIYVFGLLSLLAICLLPYLMGWVSSPKTDPQEAIVLITTSSGSGTGFLVDPTHIMTARHVVKDIPLDEEVQISFQRATIPFETSATIAYYRDPDMSEMNYLKAIKNAGSSVLNQIIAAGAIIYESDYAILELPKEVEGITPLEFSKSSEISESPVKILGYGIGDWSQVSGNITSDNFHGNDKLYKLNVDGAIGGHSGSPIMLIDNNGKASTVIGIYVGNFGKLLEDYLERHIGGEQVGVKIDHVLMELQAQGYDFTTQK